MNDVRNSKDRGWREVAAVDAAYERGEIDDDGWHRAMAELVVQIGRASCRERVLVAV